MTDRKQNSLDSIYGAKGVNEPLDITEEDVELLYDDIHPEGRAKVRFNFVPRPALKFDIEFENDFFDIAHRFSSAITGQIKFIRRDLLYDVHLTNKFLSTQAPFRIVATPTQEPITLATDENVSEVIFHIVNFFDFMADSFVFQTTDGSMIRGNRLNLTDGKFDIQIESLPQTSEYIKKLQDQGGYAITHVGAIKRKGRKSFKVDKANDALDNLLWLLSFARGMWSPPIFPTGFDWQKKRVWEKWGCVHISPWQSVLSWFDYHHGNALVGLFAPFLNKIRDPLWSESIKIAIYWFIRANTQGAGADGAIVLIQAALERLSWVYHVNVTKSISPDGFSKLQAADQIRLLLLHAHIPIKVPTQLKELTTFAKEFNFDGPGAFTYIRNHLVHPLVKGKEKDYETNALIQCWYLGLWYLELVLLYCFDYDGVYGNRLTPGRWVGETEPVPWKSTS